MENCPKFCVGKQYRLKNSVSTFSYLCLVVASDGQPVFETPTGCVFKSDTPEIWELDEPLLERWSIVNRDNVVLRNSLDKENTMEVFNRIFSDRGCRVVHFVEKRDENDSET